MSEISNISTYSDKGILKEMGACVQQLRIQADITQAQLSKSATVSRSTISAFEQGENISLVNLIKILRTLDALYLLKDFKTSDQISPLLLAEGSQSKRQRARPIQFGKTDENESSW